MARQIREHARLGASFAFETTLSGRGYARQIPRCATRVTGSSCSSCGCRRPRRRSLGWPNGWRRAATDVPEAVIRRRFHAGWRNFEQVYRAPRGRVGGVRQLRRGSDAGRGRQASMSTERRNPTHADRDPDMVGAEAAMHRAARRARQRAQIAVPTNDGEAPPGRPDGSRGTPTRRDARELSFSQAQGYEDVPGPLRLEELPHDARMQIWNLFFEHISRSTKTVEDPLVSFITTVVIDAPWSEILREKHIRLDGGALDDWDTVFSTVRRNLRGYVENQELQ